MIMQIKEKTVTLYVYSLWQKMRDFIKRFWFPIIVVCFFAVQTTGMSPRRWTGDPGFSEITAARPQHPDTIRYRNQFIHSAGTSEDTSVLSMVPIDTVPRLTARDTIFPPDSLKETDPFRYRYYVALLDSATHVFVRDSLKNAGDSIDWPRLDSLYSHDSLLRKKAAFEDWYNSLDKDERKKYEYEKKAKLKKHVMDSILDVKDSLMAIKDSIKENTPRILETFALPDSMLYKRIVEWTHEREFHRIDMHEPDTGFNSRIHDYPIFRKDVNATWLGVAGSPAQYYNFFKRESEEGVAFYAPYEPWTVSARTAPMYNTKTPYTELAYYGTLFAPSQKESDNLHIMTTQNIFPEFNFTLEYDRFGGGGIMENENTINKTLFLTANYLGRRYMMHAGYIYNMVNREENGGTSDNSMVRDTTLDAREYPVYLSNASTRMKKHTLFLDQQYRIPFTFLNNLKYRKDLKMERHFRDSVLALNDSTLIQEMEEILAERKAEREMADTLGDRNVTTAFIGHSSEYSVYRRTYEDAISSSDKSGRSLYDNFFYNPTNSYDSTRVMKLENRAFLRLQPWSDDAIVSRINGGIGNRILVHSVFDPSYINGYGKDVWNSTFLYAGAEGQLKNYINWDATGDYVFLGQEMNDMSIKANARLNFYPFRRTKKSPVIIGAHFETSLKEPDFYHQHYYSNHYMWENEFGKVSTTKIQASLSVPKWNIGLEAGYALLSNNIFFDSTAVVRQNTVPMSILSAALTKNFTLGMMHFDNRLLFQVSSNQDVVPRPLLAANARWYLQLNIAKGVLLMQLGADAWWNTKYFSQSWNPATGAFYNQKEFKYNNGPYIDAFVNMQWKRAVIFIKCENAGMGWPMDKADYFSANHFIRTQRAIKFGIYWPFYKQPSSNKTVEAGAGLSSATSGVKAPPTGSNPFKTGK